MSDAPYKIDLHIGDYLRDTEGITFAQHGAYLKLMLWYYSTAAAIPNDKTKINRRLGAKSKKERDAAAYCLDHYFELVDGYFVHKRIEEELTRWSQNTAIARSKAQKRWGNESKQGTTKKSVDNFQGSTDAGNNKRINGSTYAGGDAAAMPQHSRGNASLLPLALSNRTIGSTAESESPPVDNSGDNSATEKSRSNPIEIKPEVKTTWQTDDVKALTAAEKLGVDLDCDFTTLRQRIADKLAEDL